LKENHPDEYEIFQKEFKEEHDLKIVVEERVKMEERIAKIDKTVKRCKEEAEKADKQNNSIQVEIKKM
jgi:hypothetical protein